ncbi:MAG: hypothetical protein FWB96_01640 [Defluviitaleaceae bacterium]|nr:hypothetical protein [Defluviitaleaceae bacterium]MCL2261604.1 hypothetical protein [Defluviitaleaceae bacterium]
MRKIFAILFLAVVIFSGCGLDVTPQQEWITEPRSPISGEHIYMYIIDSSDNLISWIKTNDYGRPYVVMENVSQVSGGIMRIRAITNDGVLWQIKPLEQYPWYEPRKLMDDVIFVSCAWWATAAIQSDGSLWLWNHSGGELPENPILFFENARYVSIEEAFVIQNCGTLWEWDTMEWYEFAPVQTMQNVRAASRTWRRTAAIKNDGSLWSLGINLFGALGDGTRTERDYPVKVMENVRQVVVRGNSTMAVTEDNVLWAWGSNMRGILGDGTEEERLSPVKIMDEVLYVASDDRAWNVNAFAVRTDGSLWGWGDNLFGCLGDGTTESRLSPEKIMENVVYISAGSSEMAAVQNDGSLWIWGGAHSIHLREAADDGDFIPSPTRVLENIRLSR